MRIYCETSRLILRQFENDDRDFIRELDSDPEVMRWISNGKPSDEAEIERAMGVFMESQKRYQGKLGYFLAVEKDTSELIGWFHLRPLKAFPNDTTRLEVGYRLKRRF